MSSLLLEPLSLAKVWTLLIGGQSIWARERANTQNMVSYESLKHLTIKESRMEVKGNLVPCYLSILSNNCGIHK